MKGETKMKENTANQIKNMKEQTIGVEVEMYDISRKKAAEVAAEAPAAEEAPAVAEEDLEDEEAEEEEDAPALRVIVHTEYEVDKVVLTGELIGFEGMEILLQWQVDKGDGFENVEGATDITLSVDATEENEEWDWRLAVYYRD